MDEIDEVIKRQIRNEPIQIAEQKRKTCSSSISLTVFFRRIELDFYLSYPWFPDVQPQFKRAGRSTTVPLRMSTIQFCLLSDGHKLPYRADFNALLWTLTALLSSPEYRKARKENIGFA